MKKALLISGLLACASVPVFRADAPKEVEEKEIEVTQEDMEKAQEAFVSLLTGMMEEAENSDDSSSNEAKTEV